MRTSLILVSFVAANLVTMGSCSRSGNKSPRNLQSTGEVFQGKASWYSVRTNGGRKTASGERFQNDGMTAAHRSLPFGTHVRVTNLSNGKSLIVRINDRGPFIRGRIIDVSKGAAKKLEMVTAGVVPARVEVLAPR